MDDYERYAVRLHPASAVAKQCSCTYAARGGQLEILKYARANGCSHRWDSAAEGIHLQLLKWLREEVRLPMGQQNLFQCSLGWPSFWSFISNGSGQMAALA